MSFLKELTDKGATVAWSAVAAHPNLIALGTKDAGGGSGFEDYGGELELHMLDFSREAENDGGGGTGTVLGKVKTSARFANLAWSGMCTKQAEYPYGLIAGGMGDGTVNIWDPAKMVANHPQPQVTSVQRHTGPVTGLHFNPHKSSSHLLASGGADCEVFIMSLDRPDAPTVFVPGPQNTARHTAEVTKVAWNSQVSHIMATAAQNGSCIVWDLKQKKPWCELRDPNRAPITDLAWNPDQGQHIITASGDDNNPVLKLWDLRSSTTLPLATLAGHTEGVLSVAWCPFDASLLMSCAKDNRTLLWDLFSLKPVYELSPGAGEAAASQPESNQMFGGYGKTAQRRYQVSWAPHIPTVVATCSFDRKVQLFSMNGASTSNERAPKWHRRPAGASFGFGGRLVYFSSSQGLQFQQRGQAAGGDRGSDTNSVVKISLVKEDAAFVAASRRFEEAMASKGFEEFCLEKEASAATAHERKVWQFMQVTFLRDARKQLLTHLGVDKDAVARQAAAFVAASSGDDSDHLHHKESFKDSGDNVLDDENLADRKGAPDEAELSAAMDGIDLGASKEEKSGRLFPGRALMGFLGARGGGQGGTPSVDPLISAEAEAVIKRSLLVGNFEAAVQCCMATGNTADAMILASCGGTDLWAKTQAQYFAREMERRPFLKMVNAIIKSELGGLVESSDLNQWQETLAILSTYAKHPEFPQLCEALAARLENEAGDRKSAILCYMCAIKVSKTVNIWAEELRAANAAMNAGTDTKALQEFVEKVSVFTQESKKPPGNEVSAIFAEYANILASEGETKTAFKYVNVDVNEGQTNSCAVLLDRLYHAAPHASAGTPEPPFPFERVPVGVSSQTAVKGGSEMHANGENASRGQGNTQVDPRGKAAVGGVEPPLPSGWTQMTDPSRGIPYYCNTATGQTQWERPSPPAQPQRQPQPQPQLQPQPNAAAWGRRQAVPATPTQASFTPTRLAQQQQQQYVNPAFGGNPASVTSEGPPSTLVPSYGGPSAFTPVNVQRQQQPQYQQQQQQQQQSLLHQPQQLPLQPQYQQQQLPQQQQQPQPQYQQQQHLAAMGAPSSALATGGPGAMGGAGSAAPRMLGAHPSPYESRAAAASVGLGVPSNFQGGGGVQASEVATPGAGLHGMREGGGGAPIARNAHDYGGAAPSAMVPGQSPVPASSAASSSSQTKDASEEPPLPPASDAESQAVVSTMEEILGALSEVQLSGTEKKMLGDVTKAAGILFAKMSRNQVERDTLTKVGYLVDALKARDVKGANAIQQGLADSAWQNHKDWLKGLKHLTTLVSRRL